MQVGRGRIAYSIGQFDIHTEADWRTFRPNAALCKQPTARVDVVGLWHFMSLPDWGSMRKLGIARPEASRFDINCASNRFKLSLF